MPVKKPNSICLYELSTGERMCYFKLYNPWPEKGDDTNHLGPELLCTCLLVLNDRDEMDELPVHVTVTHVIKN